jgi:hypothetical protein
MSLKPKSNKNKMPCNPKAITKDILVILRDKETGEYHKCNSCDTLIVEGKKEMRNWGWCPRCRYPRNKSEVTKVKSGRYWNLDTTTWDDIK